MIGVRAPTAVPVYTPSVVSKPLPLVLISTGADTVGVHVHQFDWIGAEVAELTFAGSPVSAVAPTFVPVAVAVWADGRAVADAKLSFAGPEAAATLMSSIRQPVADTLLSVPIRHRNWTTWPIAPAGKVPVVVMYVPATAP